MAPPYKLTYFNITGLGESIRFLLSYGGIEFEDERIPYDNDRIVWRTTRKSDMPFGQVPILEHEGKVAHQHLAICRYVAKKLKLVGKDDWEDLEIDAMVYTWNDFRTKLGLFYYESDPAVKQTRKETTFKEVIPFYLNKLEDAAKKNGGHLCLNRLTWADVYFASFLDYIYKLVDYDLLGDYPNLQKVRSNVLSSPNLQSYLAKRPKTII